MEKDRRYKQVKLLIIKGEIKNFNQIFDTLPKSILARDLHMKGSTLTKLMKRVDKFHLSDLAVIAELCEIELETLFKLVIEQNSYYKKKR